MKKIIDEIRVIILSPLTLAAFLLCFIAVLVWVGVMMLRGDYDIRDAKWTIRERMDDLFD